MPMQSWLSMKSFKLIVAAALFALAVSCGKNTEIVCTVKDAPEASIVLKQLDVNRYSTLDTVKTDASGAFRYSLNLEEPEFVYLFYGDRQVASLLLKKGDKVKVHTDTLGAYSTEGSQECVRLQKVENSYNAFMRDLGRIIATEANPDAALSRRYVEYYRDRVTYVMQNPFSLTSVPVFFQSVNDGLPVFSSDTDGLIMRTVADSLETVYPDSKYVRALRKEAERRINLMEIASKMKDAQEIGYFDIELPGMEGKKIKLSDNIDKVTMIYFWSSTAEQKMFNITSLLPLYQEFHPRGFEIYAVALDSDKSTWAAAVRNQQLPWVNVCDTRGAASPYVSSYGVTTLPMLWLLKDGTIDPVTGVSDAGSMRAYLKKNLK